MTDENHDKIESAVNQIIAALTDITEVLELEQKPKKRRFMLEKALPTFRVGDTFTLEEDGCLYLDGDAKEQGHWKRRVMAYHKNTLEHFPNILTDWFEEVKPASSECYHQICNPMEVDHKTKDLFRQWMDDHASAPFFEEVRRFAQMKLKPEFEINFLYVSTKEAIHTTSQSADPTEWECDSLLEDKEES